MNSIGVTPTKIGIISTLPLFSLIMAMAALFSPFTVQEVKNHFSSERRAVRSSKADFIMSGTEKLNLSLLFFLPIMIFALDRIKMLHQTKESFDGAKSFDFEEFLRPSFGVYRGGPVKVRIWFSTDAAGYIKEKIWHDTQEILSQNDGSIIFEAEVAGTDEIKFWVMSWGVKAMVLEPDSLREEIIAESEALLEKYGGALLGEEQPSMA